MEAKCVVCHDNASSFRCIQCHKPVCNDCAFKTEHGVFCGRQCAAAYRDWQRTAAPKRRGGLGKVLVVLIIIAVAAAAAVKMGWIDPGKLRGETQQQAQPPAGEE